MNIKFTHMQIMYLSFVNWTFFLEFIISPSPSPHQATLSISVQHIIPSIIVGIALIAAHVHVGRQTALLTKGHFRNGGREGTRRGGEVLICLYQVCCECKMAGLLGVILLLLICHLQQFQCLKYFQLFIFFSVFIVTTFFRFMCI